jgi:hypothetical protein
VRAVTKPRNVTKPLTFRDGYTDRPVTRRGELVERVRRLKVALWSDPGDRELRDEIASAEAELHALDRAGDRRPS